MIRPVHALSLWGVLVSAVAGCNGSDVDSLARVGRKLVTGVENAAGGSESRLATSVQAVRGSLGEASVDARVALRLRWDRELAQAHITVHLAGPGVVQLDGSVTEPALRRRAVELAQSTRGVEQVIDNLGGQPAATEEK
jgi:osmotically-inducible protein OsmY